jgi:hypothetical protein
MHCHTNCSYLGDLVPGIRSPVHTHTHTHTHSLISFRSLMLLSLLHTFTRTLFRHRLRIVMSSMGFKDSLRSGSCSLLTEVLELFLSWRTERFVGRHCPLLRSCTVDGRWMKCESGAVVKRYWPVLVPPCPQEPAYEWTFVYVVHVQRT